MPIDAEQRFTCQGCGRCCHRLVVTVTPDEAESYGRAGVARWFTGEGDPFVPGPGGTLLIRKRADGACGFLSADGRCRIHEGMGARAKPLACQVFPLRLPALDTTPVTADLSCPTVVRNEGRPLREQSAEIASLRRHWARAHPREVKAAELVAGTRVPPEVADTLRSVLQEMLGEGDDLRVSVQRMAHLIDDLTRARVLKLGGGRLAEYVDLTGRHAARNATPPAPRPAGALDRLFLRAVLLLATSARLQSEQVGGWTLRWRLTQAALHLHGLAPAPAGTPDLRRARAAAIDLGHPPVRAIVAQVLRATIEGLGGGGVPLVTELARGVSLLNAALVLARDRAAAAGATRVEADHLVPAVNETADLLHTDRGSLAHRLLSTFTSDAGPLFLLADGGRLR